MNQWLKTQIEEKFNVGEKARTSSDHFLKLAVWNATEINAQN